jgi:hypothetical protein
VGRTKPRSQTELLKLGTPKNVLELLNTEKDKITQSYPTNTDKQQTLLNNLDAEVAILESYLKRKRYKKMALPSPEDLMEYSTSHVLQIRNDAEEAARRCQDELKRRVAPCMHDEKMGERRPVERLIGQQYDVPGLNKYFENMKASGCNDLKVVDMEGNAGRCVVARKHLKARGTRSQLKLCTYSMHVSEVKPIGEHTYVFHGPCEHSSTGVLYAYPEDYSQPSLGMLMNDPINDELVNCEIKFLKGKKGGITAEVYLKKNMEIIEGQQCYIAYGKAYWEEHMSTFYVTEDVERIVLNSYYFK